MTKDKKEIVSAGTHMIGALMSIVGLIFLIKQSIGLESLDLFIAYTIFGASMFFLYTASTIYHLTDRSKPYKVLLRRLDHIMIFILIAGTYTPICLIALRDSIGISLLVGIWLIAFMGIFLKVFWINAPRKLVSAIYIIMGWLSVIAIPPLVKAIGISGLAWLLLGGIIYTKGGIMVWFP